MEFQKGYVLPKKEKTIEKYLKRKIEEAGGMCLKFVSPGTRGVMDRVCLLYPGVVLWCETKKPGKELDPLQKVMKERFEKLGMKVFKVDTKEQVNELIQKYGNRL